jgi:hypothetical protein
MFEIYNFLQFLNKQSIVKGYYSTIFELQLTEKYKIIIMKGYSNSKLICQNQFDVFEDSEKYASFMFVDFINFLNEKNLLNTFLLKIEEFILLEI